MDGTLSFKRRLPEDFDDSAHWQSYYQSDFGYSTAAAALGPSSLLLQKYPYYPPQVGQEGTISQASYHYTNSPVPQPKRRRLSQDPAMLPLPSCFDCQVGEDSEKLTDGLPLLGTPPQTASLRGGSFIGAAAGGVVDFLSALITRQTSPAHENHSGYTALKQEADAPLSTQPETSDAVPIERLYTDSLNPAVAENWLADNAPNSNAPMQSFPALQPTPSQQVFFHVNPDPQSLQPGTHLESMTYPGSQQVSTTAMEQFHLIPQAADSGFPAAFQAPLDVTNFMGEALSMNSASQPVFYTSMAPSLTIGTYPSSFDESTPLAAARGSVASTHTIVPSTLYNGSPTHPNPLQQYSQQPILQDVLAVSSYTNDVAPAKFQLPRPPVSRRGPFKDHAERLRTAETRKIGSCVRCRMQRVRCNADPNNATGECLGCKRPLSKSWRLPCMRLKISDIVLGKTCQVRGYEWTLRWKENTIVDNIGNWASSDIRIVHITEGYTGKSVELKVRQFIPQEGDSLVRSWVTPAGERRSVAIPPYAVVEPQSIRAQYIKYIKAGVRRCCETVLLKTDQYGRVYMTEDSAFIWSAYQMAFDLTQSADPSLTAQERHLLSTALELYMSVRLTTRSFEIVGDETLGMPRNILDETSASPGKIPLPPVMGAQIDSVIIHEIQAKLRRDVLDGLHKLITENKARSWFTSFLVIFILLHNAALIINHDASYALKHGIKRRFAREDKVQQYYTGATTLLVYFHYCNKGIFPFTKDAREQDIRSIAHLDDRAMYFLRHVRARVAAHESKWQEMRERRDYGNDCFFISQLFEANWQPKDMVVS